MEKRTSVARNRAKLRLVKTARDQEEDEKSSSSESTVLQLMHPELAVGKEDQAMVRRHERLMNVAGIIIAVVLLCLILYGLFDKPEMARTVSAVEAIPAHERW